MTAPTTIEALMFELREGLGMLAEAGTRSRLRGCDRLAFKQIVRRLRKGTGYDPKWGENDIATLTVEWKRIRGPDGN